MSTVVDICNISLSKLGDRANVTSIDPPEGSAQADHCARFYPLARDVALEETAWVFATRRVELALTTHEAFGWAYAYFLPNDCLHIQRLVRDDDGQIQPTNAIYDHTQVELTGEDHPYTLETDSDGREIILTNLENAHLMYTHRVVDPSKYSKKFIDALAFLLASYLAGPVLKGRTGERAAERMYAAYRQMIDMSAARNANQRNHKREYVPQAMGARGVQFARNRRLGV